MAVMSGETSKNLERLLSLLHTHDGTMTLREVVFNSELRGAISPPALRAAIDLGFQNGSLDVEGADFKLTALTPTPAPVGV